MNNVNQETIVFEHLLINGSITSMEAFEKGITRLSAIIFKLKKRGLHISKVTETGRNRYGKHMSYARYFLEERDDGKNP